MSSVMNYKGYVGSVEFSENDNLLYGQVLGIKSLLSYEGTTVEELRSDFEGTVDEYLSMCEELEIEPEKAYKGTFNVRISPDLHKRAALYAKEQSITLNKFMEMAVSSALAKVMR